ncbi:MAG TPA: hypothetical protein VL284_00665 [Thermoanaerobaculia bacterium]|nr:hypothetical protein [Thermoanaerobaculia bacterium]
MHNRARPAQNATGCHFSSDGQIFEKPIAYSNALMPLPSPA